MLTADRLRHEDDPSLASDQPIGHVVSVRGSQATVGLLNSPLQDWNKVRSTVGKFLGIRAGDSLLIGVITNVSIETPALAKAIRPPTSISSARSSKRGRLRRNSSAA
jgi:hypothetical protein